MGKSGTPHAARAGRALHEIIPLVVMSSPVGGHDDERRRHEAAKAQGRGGSGLKLRQRQTDTVISLSLTLSVANSNHNMIFLRVVFSALPLFSIHILSWGLPLHPEL